MSAPSRPRSVVVALAVAATLGVAASHAAELRGSGAIAGRVRDAFTGRPAAGVEVRLTGLFDPGRVLASAVSAAGGRYRLDGIEPGLYHVYAATSAGYVGELSDGTPCYEGLRFHERFGYNCGGDPPLIEVDAGRTVIIDFALDLGGAIAGRVTAAATGEPLARVYVVVSNPRGDLVDSEPTDAAGRYRIRGLPAGGYRVSTINNRGLADEVHDGLHCDGRGRLYGPCDPRPGTPVAIALRREVGIDFALERLGAIAGRVGDAASGAALAEIDVTVWRDDLESFTVRTGADGRYRIGGLLPGAYRVGTANLGGWVDEVYDDAPCAGFGCYTATATPVPVAIDGVAQDIDFALDYGGAISGSVVAEETGVPLDRVVVHVSSGERAALYALQTRADGRFRVGGLPAGSYLLHTAGAQRHGVADEVFDGEACGLGEVPCDLDLATPVAVALGEETAGIEFTLEPLGAIAGTVTDEETGEPIDGVTLLIFDLRGGFDFAYTDAAGHYLSGPLPRGEFTVMTSGESSRWEFIDELYDGVRCFARQCDPRADGTPVVVASGATTGGVDLGLRRGAAIEGRVTRESDGQPEPFASVWVVDSQGRFVRLADVDADGYYRAPGLIDGHYFVTTAAVSVGLIDELYDRNQCAYGTGLGCVPTEGTAVPVAVGAPTPVVDFALAEGFRPGVPCEPTPTRLCLGGGRFRVGVRRFTLDEPGMARARPVSASAGAFTFFADDNLEAVVRVVDACAPFDRFWVLAASLSNLQLEAGVVDTVTGEARNYVNLDSWPTLDTAAFATCGAAAAGEPTASRAASAPPPTATAAAAGACVPGPSTLCLLGGRFAVEAEWDAGAGGSGSAGAVPLGDRSGYLWFHRPGSPEVAVKALDACALPQPGLWLFAAGLTTSEVTLTVTDTVTLQQEIYFNPLGVAFVPIRDTARFACP